MNQNLSEKDPLAWLDALPEEEVKAAFGQPEEAYDWWMAYKQITQPSGHLNDWLGLLPTASAKFDTSESPAPSGAFSISFEHYGKRKHWHSAVSGGFLPTYGFQPVGPHYST